MLIKHIEIVQKLIGLDSVLERNQAQMKFDQQETVIALLLDKYTDLRFERLTFEVFAQFLQRN